jgi:hypothetical protein
MTDQEMADATAQQQPATTTSLPHTAALPALPALVKTPMQPRGSVQPFRPGINPEHLWPPPAWANAPPSSLQPAVLQPAFSQATIAASGAAVATQLHPDLQRVVDAVLQGMHQRNLSTPEVLPSWPTHQGSAGPSLAGASAPYAPAAAPGTAAARTGASAPYASAAAPVTAAASPASGAPAQLHPAVTLQAIPGVPPYDQAGVGAAPRAYERSLVNGREMYSLLPELPQVQRPPAMSTNVSVKLPAPQKFCGTVDQSITDVELWVRDVQRYAARSGLKVQEALETVTTGTARVQVDNMLRDGITAGLTEQQFADRFALHFRTQVLPKDVRARQDLHSGTVCMAAGSKLQEYVCRFKSVILDAAPMLPADSVHWFQAGLTTELRAECNTDVHGARFSNLDTLIQHAFVQEEKLAYKAQASTAQRGTDAELNAELSYVQGAPIQPNPVKRVRQSDQQHRSAACDERDGPASGPCSSGRTALDNMIYHLGMEFGVCGGCLGLLGDDKDHFWKNCPRNPKKAHNAM